MVNQGPPLFVPLVGYHIGDNFWCLEAKGGYREENEDDFEDNTSAKEPKGKGTVELASAKHCEGDKGNMILQAQRL